MNDTRKEFYKNDFELILKFQDKEGNILPPPKENWVITARTALTSQRDCYIISHEDDIYTNAYVNEDGNVVAVFDNHLLRRGELIMELRVDYPDTNFPDGYMSKYYLVNADTKLTSDYTETTGEVIISIYQWYTYEELHRLLVDAKLLSEEIKSLDEQYRVNEEQRKAEEVKRVSAEQGRVESEEDRENAERRRESAEMLREQRVSKSIAKVNDAIERSDEAVDVAEDVSAHPTYIGTDYYVYVYDKETKAYNKTNIFVRGEGFSIAGTYPTVFALLTAPDTENGKFYLVVSNVEDPDNGKLYVKDNDEIKFLVDMSGAQGFTGKTPQIEFGTVVSGDSKADVSASLSPDGFDADGNPKYRLNLRLPIISVSDMSDVEIAKLQQPALDASRQTQSFLEVARTTLTNVELALSETRKATKDANDAAQGANNVNATLTGFELEITDRNGKKKKVNTKGESGESGVYFVALQNGDNADTLTADCTIYWTDRSYIIATIANLPEDVTSGELRIETKWMEGADYLCQLLYNKVGDTMKQYYRVKSGLSWGAWTEIAVKGKDGKDYILTETDKEEIAEIVSADFINVEEEGA